MKHLRGFITGYFRAVQFQINLRLARERIREFGPSMKGRCLDVGAGVQPYRTLFPHVDDYIATNAREFYTEAVPDDVVACTDEWVEDATDLPFEDQAFDSLLSFQVLSVVQHPERFFAESHRVLRPGGQLMLTTDFLYPKWFTEDYMRHTEHNLRSMAEAAGYEVTTLESLGGIHSMMYCALCRFIRDYPQIVMQPGSSPLQRLARLVGLAGYMVLTPFLSVAGWIIYIRERNQRDAFSYTASNFMVCRKR